MALFQQAVLNKYLSGIDDQQVDSAWEMFTAHFHNPVIRENIRNSKEEAYQEGFLDDLFVKVLGYTKNPTPDFNLIVEQKNLTDSKKADGALLDGGKVRGVIELKGTETTDLSKVEPQAFGYKNKQPDALYVIISNFEKLRFYIDNAVDFIEFNLFQLTKEEFKVLWLCLGYCNFAKGLPKKIKDASLTEEENVTKKLYKDYSAFKHDIFESVKAHNPEYDKLLLFKKTQKLLDRFLFIFFAEDRNLLPPNSIKLIIQDWHQLRDLDEYRPLYKQFVKYFGYLNKGRNIPNRAEIFAYNGGLFAEDDILNDLSIDDDLLYKHTLQLSKYDFVSEVDVNILGHIFEHSLNEIEEINAELKGEEVDTSKTRRKKDGVFYTPKYITKYIVESTIGKLCEERKAELEIDDEEYRPGRQKKTKKPLIDKLDNYRDWLLELTICDPACGSGAFLNQALEFLIAEHTYIDELQAKLLDQPMVIPDIENTILERNLFGVDINEESVEIAKLSLWLRTAQKGRKLTSLNNHIKCGNSLIDDPEVAGDKAFSWDEEFPDVFANGGFDVVIGNPPYVSLYNMDSRQRKFFDSSDSYPSTLLKYDLYILFFDKGFSILKEKGHLSYIIPSVVLYVPYAQNLREIITLNYKIKTIVDFTGFKVFSDAMVESCILSIKKSKPIKQESIEVRKPKVEIFDFHDNVKRIRQEIFLKTEGNQFRIDLDEKSIKLVEKIRKQSVPLESIYYVSKGIVAYSKVDDRKKGDFVHSKKVNEKCRQFLEGRDVSRYLIEFDSKYLEYDREIMSRPTFPELHENPKIIIRAISGGLNGTYDGNGFFIDQKLIICSDRKLIKQHIASGKKPKTKILDDIDSIDYHSTLGILNSKLSSFYYLKMLKGGVSILPEDIRQFPIFPYSKNRKELSLVVKSMLDLTQNLSSLRNEYIKLLQSKFDIDKPSRKLQSWHELTFKQFLKELKKKKVELSLDKEAEWMEYFNKQKAKADELKSQIAQTDKEIDTMVYELYGLSEEEIRVIEGNH